MIDEYKFGSIIVDGKTYNQDVEIRWTDEILPWWRKESHVIDIENIKRAVEQNPEIIIIGTGESGIAKVTERTQKFIKDKGIKLVIDITEQAIRIFNVHKEKSEKEEEKQKKVIGMFHLTC